MPMPTPTPTQTKAILLGKLQSAPGITGSDITPLKTSSHHSINKLIATIVATSNPNCDPFYVLDLGSVVALFLQWRLHLPTITPFFAVKCNPTPALLATLAHLGANFDCASAQEITQVLDLGIAPDRILFANPCKAPAHIVHARDHSVDIYTFDSVHELEKIKTLHPTSSLLLRIKPPLTIGVRRSLGDKYGALQEEVRPLLLAAKSMKLAVVGVSFHVGICATMFEPYDAAISAARAIFDLAASDEIGLGRMRVLDVGGGFMAGRVFEEAAEAINASVSAHFGDWSGLRVIAEPGRYFAETAATLACCVIGKRVREGRREYWLNDGMYGSMKCVMMDAVDVNLVPLKEMQEGEELHESTVFGPTCDSMDVVVRGGKLPEMEVGDWMVAARMGAYAKAMGSEFNGFSTKGLKIYLAMS